MNLRHTSLGLCLYHELHLAALNPDWNKQSCGKAVMCQKQWFYSVWLIIFGETLKGKEVRVSTDITHHWHQAEPACSLMWQHLIFTKQTVLQRLAVLNYLPTLSNSINTTQIWVRNGTHIPSSSASQKTLNKWNRQTDKMAQHMRNFSYFISRAETSSTAAAMRGTWQREQSAFCFKLQSCVQRGDAGVKCFDGTADAALLSELCGVSHSAEFPPRDRPYDP